MTDNRKELVVCSQCASEFESHYTKVKYQVLGKGVYYEGDPICEGCKDAAFEEFIMEYERNE